MFRTLKSSNPSLWKNGLRELLIKSGEKISSTFSQQIREIHSAENPQWLSDVGLQSYCLDNTEYVIAQTEPNETVELLIDASNSDCIEIPIVGVEHSKSIELSTKYESNQLIVDSKYTYPSQLWTSVNVPDEADNISVRVSTTGAASKRGIIDRFTPDDTNELGTRVGLPALHPENPQPPIFLISNITGFFANDPTDSLGFLDLHWEVPNLIRRVFL